MTADKGDNVEELFKERRDRTTRDTAPMIVPYKDIKAETALQTHRVEAMQVQLDGGLSSIRKELAKFAEKMTRNDLLIATVSGVVAVVCLMALAMLLAMRVRESDLQALEKQIDSLRDDVQYMRRAK